MRQTKYVSTIIIFICFLSICNRPALAVLRTIDLNNGVPFEHYVNAGDEKQKSVILNRINATKPSAAFVAEVKNIQSPLVVAVVSSVSCPDCTALTPFLLALGREGDNIEIKFFARNTATRALLSARTGFDRVPTVLFANSEGQLYEGAFIEYPEHVKTLIGNAKSEEEANAVIRDFRARKYNTEIEKDILTLLKKAEDQIRSETSE